jgi:cytochrome c
VALRVYSRRRSREYRRPMTMRFRLPALIALAALLSACGNDDEPSVPPAPIPAAEPAAPALPTAPSGEPAAPVQPATPAAPAPPAAEPAPIAPAAEPVVPSAPVVEPAPEPLAPVPADPTPPAAPAEPLAPAAAVNPAPLLGADELPVDIALRARIAAIDPVAATAFAAPCLICHVAEPGAAGRLGPNLYEVVGRAVAGDPAFAYSPALVALAGTGAAWTYERLDAFLANPQAAVPGTRMSFAGYADPEERAGTIAWLRSLAAEPAPLAAGIRPEGRIGIATTFSAAQAEAGADAYVRQTCVRCHGDTLRGVVDVRAEDTNGGDGPSLRSANFHNHFFRGSIAELFTYIQDRMPPTARGTLPDETVLDIIAFILDANGFAPGEPLPADRAALQAMGFWQ